MHGHLELEPESDESSAHERQDSSRNPDVDDESDSNYLSIYVDNDNPSFYVFQTDCDDGGTELAKEADVTNK